MNFKKYFQEEILTAKRLKHSGNNVLYRITTASEDYLVKQYSELYKNHWNKAKKEFEAISTLFNKGFSVPRPIKFDDSKRIGIYSFESGRVLSPSEVSMPDIEKLAEFLAKLHSIDSKTKKGFAKERTCCLSIRDYAGLLQKRYKNILSNFKGNEEDRKFLTTQVADCIEELSSEVFKKVEFPDKKLTLEEQVVTPGDFGFHNALYENGRFTFIDFEYFGRDDPAKQVMDFLHHDKTRQISRKLKLRFLETYSKSYRTDAKFYDRLQLIDSWIGLNWVLIYLNALSKDYQEHMKFSGKNVDRIVAQRIQKAENKINNLRFFKTTINDSFKTINFGGNSV